MNRVLLVSHTGRATGFGGVVAGIAAALAAARFDVHVVGLGRAVSGERWVGHVHDDMTDPTRTSTLARLGVQLNPDAIVAVGQGEIVAWQIVQLQRDGVTCPVVSYVPVEGDIVDPSRLQRLADATRVVAYTPGSASALAAALGRSVSSIPHATPPGPCLHEPRADVRRALLPRCADRVEGVWILHANRNDWRKRPELTIEAFATVVSAQPSATLLMHCAVQRAGVDLALERDRLGLGRSVVFTHEHAPAPWPPTSMRKLFACCEIGVSSTTGEGWGLVAIEHARHGAAQIMPAHATLREIWGPAPRWVPTTSAVPIDWVFGGHSINPTDLASAMLELVQDSKVRSAVGKACDAAAARPELNSTIVGAQWIALIHNMIARPTDT